MTTSTLAEYDKKWFSERAFSCLKKVDSNKWDYSDSLLLYSSQGQNAYEVAHDESSPYFRLVTQPEHLFLKAIAKDLAKVILDYFEYFDLGAGVENKEAYFFNSFKNKNFNYVPVDVSEYFLSIATKNAEREGVKVEPLKASFEELPLLLGKNKKPRFITLLGLTFSNYLPSEILKLLLDIAGKNGYIFFDVQLRERVNIGLLQKVYQKYVAPACVQKIKLLDIDPKKDIGAFITTEDISIWCSMVNVNYKLEKLGVKTGDKIKVFQSLRPSMENLKSHLGGLDYEIFDVGNSFVGILIKT